jgi:tetratricopeptide (TPR) repeat protein
VRFSIVLGQLQYLPIETRERLLRPALEKAPNDFSLLCSVISMYQNSSQSFLNKLNQQLRYSQAAVAVRPGSKAAWKYFARARWDGGHLDDAIRSFRRALRIDPDDVFTLSNLSAIQVRRHDPEAALLYSEKAVRVNPKSAVAQNSLGLVFDRMNDIDASLRCYEKALELDPAIAEYQNNLGYAYLRKHNLNEAVHHFREALELSPNFRQAQNNLSYTQELRRPNRELERAPPPRSK